VVLHWNNPKANKGRADVLFVSINNELVTFKSGPIPTHITVPASRVPAGDLAVEVDGLSSQDFHDAGASVKLAAKVPFSGSAASAGYRRYRVSLDLAPSWGKKLCHLTTCEGIKLYVVSAGKVYVAYLDENGHAVATVRSIAHAHALVVRVRSAKSYYHRLDMKVHVKVGHQDNGDNGGDFGGGKG